jgi:tripartite-type tricarboxylate transporter receptor subunit TctC
VQYDPVRDFTGLSLIARAPQVLVVDPKLGLKTTEQFVQYARRRNPEVTFSTAGSGSSSRLSMELMRNIGKFEVTFVPFKGGAPAVNAVLGGQVTGMLASIGVVVNQIKAGKLTALGVSSANRRNPLLPDVPPIAEVVPGFDAQSWIGMGVPAATPRPIVERLNGAIVHAAQAQDVREKLESQGMEVVASGSGPYNDWVRTEVNKWRPLIQALKIQAE